MSKRGGQSTDGNYMGRITEALQRPTLKLFLSQVHCCPVKIGPSIVRAVAFSKEAENPNFYGKCPGVRGKGLDQEVRKSLIDKVTSE